jgi:hypothetical protein
VHPSHYADAIFIRIGGLAQVKYLIGRGDNGLKRYAHRYFLLRIEGF